MDTQAVVRALFESEDWKYRIDPLDGEILTGFAVAHGEAIESVHLVVIPRATSIEVRAPRLLGSGGADGELDPTLALLVATMSYEHRLPIGVDLRDGEIMAWTTIHLAGVDEELWPRVVERDWRSFVVRLHKAVVDMLQLRDAAAATHQTVQLPVSLTQPIPVSA